MCVERIGSSREPVFFLQPAAGRVSHGQAGGSPASSSPGYRCAVRRNAANWRRKARRAT
ncbi:hypothetical protein AZ22_1078 [Bordetella bronchiseptica 980-2]|nr:hypothetical protein AZ22_1078 [Bordetella bronchiseptica 980-2]KDB58698.1 hypothetical protein AZ16_1282 [Bordetella bronchiseptica B18-5 (C3)]KDD50770.1 hypothetical protein L534_1322 [Bordetella bronchiseptica RB630]